MNNYWQERFVKTQQELTTKSIKETKKQLQKYCLQCYKNLLGQFEATYNTVILQMNEGKQITPAHLYNLDKYWKLQAQLKKELEDLGYKQIALLEQRFNILYTAVWLSFDLPESTDSWALLDKNAITQVINSIWCADGKTWSQRIWDNTDKLQQALNDGLISCVVNGSNPDDLRKQLMKEFNTSYERASTLVNTEMAHIQTEAAKNRYRAAGCREVEVYGEEDSGRCDICGKLHGQHFPIAGAMPIPAHPNCRCCLLPVVEDRTDFSKETDSTPKNLTNDKNIDNIAVSRGRNISQEWKTAKFRDKKAEEKHYKHLVEYGDISFEEYIEGARMLLSQPIGQNVDGFINNSGATYRYDIINNDFAIGKEGFIYTRFKPIDAIEYWERIKRNELKQK